MPRSTIRLFPPLTFWTRRRAVVLAALLVLGMLSLFGSRARADEAPAPLPDGPAGADEGAAGFVGPPAPAPVADKKPEKPEANGDKLVVKAAHRTPYWDDADQFGASLSRGSIGVCEALTTPLGILPYVGFAAAWAIEWFCIVPGALTLDYVAARHGDDPNGAWGEGAAALAAAKLWKDATTIPVYIAAGAVFATTAVFLTGLTVASLVAFPISAAWVFVPMAIGAVAAATGGAWVAAEYVRDVGADALFWWVYDGLGDADDQRPQVAKARHEDAENAILGPDPNFIGRYWTLASLAAGVKPDAEPLHFVPLAGPIALERDRAAMLKERMHRVASDVFFDSQTEEELEPAHLTIDVVSYASGVVGAVAQGALVTAGLSAAVALVAAAFIAPAPFVAVPVMVAFGLVSLASGLVGLTSLGVRKLVQATLPGCLPFAYGVFDDDDPRDEEPARPVKDGPAQDGEKAAPRPPAQAMAQTF